MTKQATEANHDLPLSNEGQYDAAPTQTPQNASSIDEQTAESKLASAPETDPNKTFAHDINHKLDDLELDINELTGRFKTSQSSLSNALGDLKSRTALMTSEIDKVASQIEKSDGSNKELIETLNQRLGDAVSLLNVQLGNVDGQLESQHSSIKSLREDLKGSYAKLEHRLTGLERETQAKLYALYTGQEEQGKTQQLFSDALDSLQDQTNQNADYLFEIDRTVTHDRKLARKQVQIAGGAIALCTILLASSIAYLNSSQNQSIAQLGTEISALGESSASNLTPLSTTQQLTQRVDVGLSQLGANTQAIQTLQASTSEQAIAMNDSIESVAEKVAALELSLYGPADGALATPSLMIHDASWIAAQNAGHYAIQLVGVYRERALVDFTNKHAKVLGNHPLATNVSEYRGQHWHNLVYGNFASFSEAQAALDALPNSLQKNSPWVRQMGSIQKTAIN